MRVYTNSKFQGHYPVGTAAVVVAESPQMAAKLLEKELLSIGLEQTVGFEDMVPLNCSTRKVRVLCDGKY